MRFNEICRQAEIATNMYLDRSEITSITQVITILERRAYELANHGESRQATPIFVLVADLERQRNHGTLFNVQF